MSVDTLVNTIREAGPTLSAGLISADMMRLGAEVQWLEQTGLPLLHFDVMDGCFVPGLTVGPPFIKGIKSRLLKDVHLMVNDPLEKVESYVKAGADLLSFHLEASADAGAVLERLAELTNANDPERGLIRGLALLPETPVAALKPLLGRFELLTLLAVDPVGGNHPPFEATRARVAEAQSLLTAAPHAPLMCIDGGVKADNIAAYAELGADFYISGSALFQGKEPLAHVKGMLANLARAGGGSSD